MATYEPSNARDLINRFIDSIGARDETGVVPFVQGWPRIVGRDKAAHSQVLDVRNGTVLIGVDHPAWLQRMHMDRRRIVERIRRDFPSLQVRNLAFTIVDHLSNPWQGDTGDEDDTTAAANGDDSRGNRSEPGHPGGRSVGTDEASGVDDEAAKSDTTSAGTAETGGDAPTASQDDEFQRHLAGLRRALEEKERADSGVDDGDDEE